MSEPGAPGAQRPPGMRVLLVEDNDGDAELVREYLADAPQRIGVCRVATLAAALEALRIDPPDIVLLDLSLPDATSLDGLSRLRSAFPAVAIVVLTGIRDEELGARALNEGAQDYLTKGAIDGPLLSRALRYARERQLVARRESLHVQERAARLAAEAAGRASDERASELSAILAAIADIVVVYHRDGVVSAANPVARERFGFDPVGLRASELAHRLELRRLDGSSLGVGDGPVENALHGEGMADEPATFAGPGGKRHIVQRVAAPFGSEGGRGGVVAVWRDVTEREELVSALREKANALGEADRRKDEFLALLGHELRNPLAAISTAGELLAGGAPGEERRRRLTEVVRRQTGQLTRMVDDLLDVSRITRGRIALSKKRLDLLEIVHSAVTAAQPRIDALRHRLLVQLPAEPALVDADPHRITQVVANLLDNASKYTKPGGEIRLALERGADEVVLRVRDNGIGIAPELLPRVFDLFEQGEVSLGRTQGGLGIGLTVVRSLVELHGGTVEARSAGLGRGAEFTVRLPAAVLREARSPEESPAAAAPGRALRVLVVEDNADVAEVMVEYLRERGHSVALARSGEDAIRDALSSPPDVMLVDIGLPDLDGYGVVRRLQPQLSGRTRFVALTGYGQPEDRRRAVDAGFHAHLVKPATADQIERVLAA